MSLDVYLTKVMPTEVFSSNITHNLGKMAQAVQLKEDLTLYQVLWRPDEIGITEAGMLAPHLIEGLKILVSDPVGFKQYNPENGWGSYEGLVQFVKDYLLACIDNPEAEIGVSR